MSHESVEALHDDQEMQRLDVELARIKEVIEGPLVHFATHARLGLATTVPHMREGLSKRQADVRELRELRGRRLETPLPAEITTVLQSHVSTRLLSCRAWVENFWTELHGVVAMIHNECRRLWVMAANLPSLQMISPPKPSTPTEALSYEWAEFFAAYVEIARGDWRRMEHFSLPKLTSGPTSFAEVASETQRLYLLLVPESFVPSPELYMGCLRELAALYGTQQPRLADLHRLLADVRPEEVTYRRLLKLLLRVERSGPCRHEPQAPWPHVHFVRMLRQLAHHVERELRSAISPSWLKDKPCDLWRRATGRWPWPCIAELPGLLDELDHFVHMYTCVIDLVEAQVLAGGVPDPGAWLDRFRVWHASLVRRVPPAQAETLAWSDFSTSWRRLLEQTCEVEAKGHALACVVPLQFLGHVKRRAQRALELDVQLEPPSDEMCTLVREFPKFHAQVEIVAQTVARARPVPLVDRQMERWQFGKPTTRVPHTDDCSSGDAVNDVCLHLALNYDAW